MRFSVRYLIAALAIAAAPLSVQAASIFSATYTGAEYAALAPVSSNATASVSGSSVTYTVTNSFSPMAVLGLLSPWPRRGDLIMSATVVYDALTTDNDLGFGFSDGSSLIGALQADNSGGALYSLDGSASNLNLISSAPLFSSTVSLTLLVPQSGDPATLSVTSGAFTLSDIALSSGLTTGNVLSFGLYGNDVGESYRINSVSIDVSVASAVPLPAGGVLLIGGLGGLIALRKRRA